MDNRTFEVAEQTRPMKKKKQRGVILYAGTESSLGSKSRGKGILLLYLLFPVASNKSYDINAISTFNSSRVYEYRNWLRNITKNMFTGFIWIEFLLILISQIAPDIRVDVLWVIIFRKRDLPHAGYTMVNFVRNSIFLLLTVFKNMTAWKLSFRLLRFFLQDIPKPLHPIPASNCWES